MRRISLFVSDRQYEEFKALGESWGQPAAELIRQALNDFLEKHQIAAGSKKRTARKRASTRRRA